MPDYARQQAPPWVSVVMPSLNQVQFIGAAIDSVLGQDYPNLELIVADGGSNDGTLALLEQKGEADPRLGWFSARDSGPANAVNKALAKVRGTIIGWLNSDDLYAPGSIMRAVEALDAHPQWLMVYGQGEHIDQDGKVLNRYPTLPPETPLQRFTQGCFICQPTVFFRRTQFVLLGGLDERLKTAFDFDYWLRAFSRFPDRIGFVDSVQALSRLHENCITLRMRRTVALEGMKVIARHMGAAPPHWIMSYVNELFNQQRDAHESPQGLREHVLATIEEAKPWLKSADFERLVARFEQDKRLDSIA